MEILVAALESEPDMLVKGRARVRRSPPLPAGEPWQVLHPPVEGKDTPLGIVTKSETPLPGVEQSSNGIHAGEGVNRAW
jgi:hypothetical protein